MQPNIRWFGCVQPTETVGRQRPETNKPLQKPGTAKSEAVSVVSTPTALPARTQIGLRHPVNFTLAQLPRGPCDPSHKRLKKVAARLWGKPGRARTGLGRGGVGMWPARV